jgi:hypothetical protein
MSQQSDLAEHAHERLSEKMLPAAHLVRLVRERWGVLATPISVHLFVAESIRCLLRYDDVEVGDIVDAHFIPWASAPNDSEDRIEDEFCGFDSFLDDDTRYVFRKRT